MIRQILLLLKLKFTNFLGVNESMRSGKKKSAIAIFVLLVLVGLVLCFYVGGLSYLFASSGLGELLPVLYTIITSLIIFFFTIFKSGAEIFDYSYYCSVAHLPLKRSAIISARLIGMYITDAIISLLIFLSGSIGISIVQMQSVSYYLMMILSAFLVPVLPLCLSCFIGVGVSALVSRLKKAKLVASILTCILVSAVAIFTYFIPEEMDDSVMITAIGDLVRKISSVYPPAMWVYDGVSGLNILNYALFAVISIAVAVLFVVIVAKVYVRLCLALGSTHSTNVKIDIKKSKANSPFFALYKKELKKLFSSSIYVMNTLIGNVMAIIAGVSIVFIELGAELEGVDIGPFLGIIVIGAISIFANMSPTTTACIGVEGKSFDITKSLPVSDKEILYAKLLVAMTFSVPTAVIVTICAILSPLCIGVPIWVTLLSPIIFAFAIPITGLVMNIKAPCLKWTNEQIPVKQGRAVLFTMLITFGFGLAYITLGAIFGEIAVGVLLAVIVAFTVWLYKYLQKVDLRRIN